MTKKVSVLLLACLLVSQKAWASASVPEVPYDFAPYVLGGIIGLVFLAKTFIKRKF